MKTRFENADTKNAPGAKRSAIDELGEMIMRESTKEQPVDEVQDDSPDNIFAPELTHNPISEIREVEGSEGIFNVTVLEIDGVDYLFGRKVEEAAPWGKPDTGALVMSKLNSNRRIVATTEVWNPDGKDLLIEDPRARQTPAGTTIGVTVVRTSGDRIRPYPGIIKLGSPKELLSEPFPEARIIEKFGGGNQATPLGDEVEGKNATSIDETHLMYRPEGMNHTLQVLECNENDDNHVGFIDFPPDIPWATYKIGTTTTPQWLNDCEAFFVVHGINIVDDLYVYSIGTARLLRTDDSKGKVSFSVDNISREAIITPDSFPELTDGRQVELHPDKRRALYNCGAIPKRDSDGNLMQEELFPNQGDKRTWSAVVNASTIIANWDRTVTTPA